MQYNVYKANLLADGGPPAAGLIGGPVVALLVVIGLTFIGLYKYKQNNVSGNRNRIKNGNHQLDNITKGIWKRQHISYYKYNVTTSKI